MQKFESKQEEINCFKRFYESLAPGSYLKDIFRGVPEIVEKMIQNDWAYSIDAQVNDVYAENEAQRKENIRLREEKKKLENEITRLQRSCQMLQTKRKEIAEELEKIAWMLKNFQTNQ